MKKSLLLLAALSTCSGLASAQSSVTVFGILDAAVTNVKNGSAGSRKTLSSGQGNTSRLGFRGVEDLGGGLKASFWLEGQVDVDTGGTSGFDWSRRATVSLTGNFGELRMGRDQNPSYLNWGARDLFSYVGVATTSNVRGSFLSQGGATTGVRTSNSVAYFLPDSLGGVYGSVMVGAGEGVTGNKYIGARLGYRTGPFNVSAAVGNTAKTGAMLDDLTTTSLGASYKIGEATLIGGYEKAKYSTRDRTLINIGVKMTVGNGEISAQVAQTSGTGAPATPDQYDAKLFGMGYEHSLSKRTVLYATVGRIDNGGTSVTGGTLTTTGNGPSGMKRGETSSGYQFGMRHSF